MDKHLTALDREIALLKRAQKDHTFGWPVISHPQEARP